MFKELISFATIAVMASTVMLPGEVLDLLGNLEEVHPFEV